MMRRREKIWLSSLALVLLVVAGGAWHYNRQARIAELFEAFTYGDYGQVRQWVENGGDPNISFNEMSLLASALVAGDDEFIVYLLEAGADPNYNGNGLFSPTEFAATINSLEIIQACIDKGGVLDPNFSRGGMTPLGYRLSSAPGDKRVARFLLEKGADPNGLAYGVWPVIFEASQYGDAEVVRMLCEYGADVTVAYPLDGRTALHAAAAQGHSEMARLLIENGANPSTVDAGNRTPLDFARSYRTRVWGDFDKDEQEALNYLNSLSLEDARAHVRSLGDEGEILQYFEWLLIRETIEYLESFEEEQGNK